MRYVLLLLTLLTAGFSVWYYQNRISPEGKELAAQKTTLEQEAAILEKAVIQSRKKLDDAQDATRAAEEDIERFQQAYLQQKRQQHQEIQDSAYQKSVADQQEEVKEHDQKIDRLRRRMKRQRESTKSAREELLRKKEGMRTQLDRLTDQQRSIQAELEQAERELAQKREEAKSRKKLSGIAPQKGNISELQAQMNLIRQKTAAAKEKMKAVDAALETLEEKSGKQERLMQKAEEKLTEQKNKVLADDDRDESAVPEPGDEDLLAVAEYRELSGDVRKTLEQARKKEEQASRAYDEARAAMRKASREEVKKLAKKEKDHASFQKLFTGAAPSWDLSCSCSRVLPQQQQLNICRKMKCTENKEAPAFPQGVVDGRQGYDSLRPA